MIREIQNIYRKNKDDFRALLFRTYPDFVYKTVKEMPKDEIPVFTFHSVEHEYFEAQMRYLADNHYRTIDSDEYHDILLGNVQLNQKTVVLTFDDGRGSLWSVAYPILKKYGLKAISFIVPFCIKDATEDYPTLDDVWNGAALIEDVQRREEKELLCSWKEIKRMHKDGIIDFQSHSSFHHSVFITKEFVDFINPSFRPKPMCGTLNPVVRKNGVDKIGSDLDFGHPIYRWAPSLSTSRRYVEDEALSNECTNYVSDRGGRAFFQQAGWRQQLRKFMKEHQIQHAGSGRFQNQDERVSDIHKDLLQSKNLIEEKLDKYVRHFCFPWYAGSDLAGKISQEVGYYSNYWGLLQNRSINRIGDNPYYLARMNDEYIFSLPGRGRTALYELLLKKYLRVTNKKMQARNAQANSMASEHLRGHS